MNLVRGIIEIISIVFMTLILGNYIEYKNNIAVVTVYLDDEIIYQGADRNIVYEQLGENGSKYLIREYRKGFWNRVLQKIVNVWCGADLKVVNK